MSIFNNHKKNYEGVSRRRRARACVSTDCRKVGMFITYKLNLMPWLKTMQTGLYPALKTHSRVVVDLFYAKKFSNPCKLQRVTVQKVFRY